MCFVAGTANVHAAPKPGYVGNGAINPENQTSLMLRGGKRPEKEPGVTIIDTRML